MINTFNLSDYDCIGFDLDNTICEYRIAPMVQMIYDVITEYLIKTHNYSAKYLQQPIDFAFLQKGLLLDTERGNVLKLNGTGKILKSSHGTRFMSDEEIMSVYGSSCSWSVTDSFIQNFMDTWNGPLSEKIRPLLDYFDFPISLVFARCIDSVDDACTNTTYNVWPDIFQGLHYMYSRDNFSTNVGDFFFNLKTSPTLYYNKCPNYVINWLKELKKTKKMFLISGSHVDYASFSATQSLGANWKELFDIAVFFSKKPGFFNQNRPFYNTDDLNETSITDAISLGKIYSQGNWSQLYNLFKKETGKSNPKCLYMGDNILQDVLTPEKFSGLDTIAIVEEMKMDSDSNEFNTDIGLLQPNKWGSYFIDNDKNEISVWTSFIINHSKLCIPSIKALASKPINYEYKSFCKSKIFGGFFPFTPNNMYKLLK
ncbi:5'-nucleotidase domain-containing protein 1 [Daktulosphaira vitifoliae]|uniref:5'-nucleotidase domain-containing protein 1 n=1 Tax=Daktulosphaira vitifoliae TaxID=58002 RepID=UPI0021A9AECF|nr:5'-nucleotidase domain-containing protein 1 [Daktulosphaira vitifoliae]